MIVNFKERIDIFESFFSMHGKLEPFCRSAVHDEIEEYLIQFSADVQMQDLKRVSHAYRIELDFKHHKKSRELVRPIFDRLTKEGADWDYYDTRLLITCIDLNYDIMESINISKKIITKLEEYSYREDYINILLELHINMMSLLCEGKYYVDTEDFEQMEELNKAFDYSVKELESINETNDDILTEAYLLLRKGFFYDDRMVSYESLDLTDEIADPTISRFFFEEIEEDETRETLGMSIYDFRKIIGEKIKRMRIRHGYSITEIAEYLRIPQRHVVCLETGLTGSTDVYLYRLRVMYKCEVDDLDISAHEYERLELRKETDPNSTQLFTSTEGILDNVLYYIDNFESNKDNEMFKISKRNKKK